MTPTFHGNSSVMKLMFLRIGDGMGSDCVGHLLKASRDLTVCHWVIIHTVCLCGYYNGLSIRCNIISGGPTHNKDGLLVRFIGCVVVVASY
jgi:hypothetical protein